MKLKHPVFTDNIYRDAYRFILEYEADTIHADLKFDSKKYKESEWTYEQDRGMIFVHLCKQNDSMIVLQFALESYPVLVSHLKNNGNAQL